MAKQTVMKVDKQYICGLGEITFGAIECSNTKTQGLHIGRVDNKDFGSDVEDFDNIYDNTVIWIKNEKGLDSLQRVIDEIRIRL